MLAMVSKVICLFLLGMLPASADSHEATKLVKSMAKFASAPTAKMARPGVTGGVRLPVGAAHSNVQSGASIESIVSEALVDLEESNQELKVAYQQLRARVQKMRQTDDQASFDSAASFGWLAGLLAYVGLVASVGVVAVRKYSRHEPLDSQISLTPQRAGLAPRTAPVIMMAKRRLLDELEELDGETSGDLEAESMPAAPSTPKEVLESETLFFEGPPSKTELIVPGISILTVIGIIPFVAAAARQFWVKYKITSRRISVQSGFGGQDFTEIVYNDIVDLKFVYRGSKEVGDMVISLRDGAKLEMRFVPDFQNIYRYIYERCSPACQEDSVAMAA